MGDLVNLKEIIWNLVLGLGWGICCVGWFLLSQGNDGGFIAFLTFLQILATGLMAGLYFWISYLGYVVYKDE